MGLRVVPGRMDGATIWADIDLEGHRFIALFLHTETTCRVCRNFRLLSVEAEQGAAGDALPRMPER